MALVTQDYIDAVNNLDLLRGFNKENRDPHEIALTKDQEIQLNQAKRVLVERLQTIALTPDLVAQAFLNLTRKFIINSNGTNVVVTMNSTPFTFVAGSIYCVDPGEAQFFKGNAPVNTPLSDSTLAAWVAAGGVVKTFYW